MAAQAWKFYNKFKEYMADGTIDLDTTTFDIHLFQSASDFATATQSTLTELSSEVASGTTGYSNSGAQLSAVTWATGASASEMRFDCTAKIWTATTGSIANIKAAVIVARTGASGKDGTNKLVCYASLTSTQFTLTSGNTLTITPSANGIFELN
jgi:hypothetical protein